MLIKKTIVLQNGGVTVGYVTLVRVGSEVGVKTVLNFEPDGKLTMGLKTTSGNLYTQTLDSKRTESKPSISLMPTDEVGIVIVDDNGKRVCEGGRKETVNVNALLNINNGNAPVKQTATAENEEPTADGLGKTKDNVSQSQDVTDVVDGENRKIGKTSVADTVSEETIVSNLGKDDLPPFYMNKGENFYKNVRSRLNDLMTANPRESALEELIPESKWVRVYYDKDEYYVVGILSEEGKVTFLAYGVPGVEGVRPPKEAEELCDFLELPNAMGEGYWIMFQNAENGEIAKSI